MSKFKKKSKTSQEIPTSALPDIIFMLLFFFMVTTVLREATILVENKLPSASQLQKLEQKSLVANLYLGKPRETDRFGSEPRIQVNDVLIELNKIEQWVLQEKDKLPEVDRDKLTISLRIDKECKMGIVNDVKLQLRKAKALKVNYASVQKAS
ncbi:MAG: biopolymer transporter ExbD [Cytophagales bacterium]|nr:biopolymer transporter ExbD [Cytophagales bacterium]MDW8383306.1 biopolymer transporter ExbD [Flammeovirgaceae bacterium]